MCFDIFVHQRLWIEDEIIFGLVMNQRFKTTGSYLNRIGSFDRSAGKFNLFLLNNEGMSQAA